MKFLKTIGIISDQGVGIGFSGPIATAFDSKNTAFVLNRGHEDQGSGNLFRVTVQTFEEKYLTEFATWYGDKPGDKKLNTPSDLEFDSNDHLYITDEVNNAVFIYDVEGSFIGQWGKYGNNEGEFSGPSGIAIDSKDNLYVVDQYNHRIQKFTKDGKYITSYGKTGSGKGELVRPSDVAVDSKGMIYISDWGNERVVVINQNGEYISSERGRSTLTTEWTNEFFESNVDERASRSEANLIPDLPQHLQTPYHMSSQSEPLFWGITDLSIDNSGRLYVTEYRRHRCQIFNIHS